MKLSRKELRQLIAESINESMSHVPASRLIHMLNKLRHFLQAVRMMHGISPQEISVIIGLRDDIAQDDINWVRSPRVNQVLMILHRLQNSGFDITDAIPELPLLMRELQRAKDLMNQGF